jgi:hypothetical protein
MSVGLDDFLLFKTRLDSTKTYTMDHPLDLGEHVLWVKLEGKTNADTTETEDQAIEISAVTVEGISADRFIWRGVYTPEYPEPWASQQAELSPEITNTNYLGWNGIWRLRFSVPVFRWIHEVEHLGWIYD